MAVQDTQNAEGDAVGAKKRLLDAAEQVFGERGFDGASIRDVTAKANCNLAAVNYHFGDKETLYEEVFRRRLSEMRDRRLASINSVMARQQGITLEDIIRADAEAFLEPFADRSISQRFLMLFTREMVEEHLPKGFFLDEMAIPVMNALGQALRSVCPFLTEQQSLMAIHSIIGQLVHTIHLKVMPEAEILGQFDTKQVIDHIVRFSAAGIRAYAMEAK